MDIMNVFGLLGGGAFLGGFLMRMVDFGNEKHLFEKATEHAEKRIPEQFQKPLGKILNSVADELMTKGQDKIDSGEVKKELHDE